MVKTKEDIIRAINKNKARTRELGVNRLGVFGSYIRGEQDKNSDIDLLVEFDKEKKTYSNYIKLAELYEDLLGTKVDLLTPESLSPYMAPNIIKEVEYVQIGD